MAFTEAVRIWWDVRGFCPKLVTPFCFLIFRHTVKASVPISLLVIWKAGIHRPQWHLRSPVFRKADRSARLFARGRGRGVGGAAARCGGAVLEMMYPTVVEGTKDRIAMRFGPPGRLLSPLLTAQLKWRIGCTAEDLRPILSVAKISVPKLFIAGTEDRDTTFKESKEIFAWAAEPKTFVPFEGARHEDLLALAPDQYRKVILEFLETHLK